MVPPSPLASFTALRCCTRQVPSLARESAGVMLQDGGSGSAALQPYD